MNFAPDKHEVYFVEGKSHGIIYDFVNRAFYKIPASQVAECKKIKEAYNQSIRISSKNIGDGFLDFSKIRKIELIMTNAGNLNCTYCFAHGGSYNKKIRKISKEVYHFHLIEPSEYSSFFLNDLKLIEENYLK